MDQVLLRTNKEINGHPVRRNADGFAPDYFRTSYGQNVNFYQNNDLKEFITYTPVIFIRIYLYIDIFNNLCNYELPSSSKGTFCRLLREIVLG